MSYRERRKKEKVNLALVALKVPTFFWIRHAENEFDIIGSFSRRLDDNIRTVVRGQTNVGQDGRQVCVSCLR